MKIYFEEKQAELQTQFEERLQKQQRQGKKLISKNDKNNIENIELPFEMIIKMYRKELKNNVYTNRGYILDGFPTSYKEFYYLFKIN